jgi:hypothetical protein
MLTKRISAAALAALFAVAGATTASAHHSFAAEFDSNKPVHLEGTVVEFQWVNPHSWLVIDVDNPDGTTTQWRVEGGAPSALLRRGWTKDTLPAGTRVQVDGFQAKDGKPRANARNIVFPDGKSMFIGSTGIGAAPGSEDAGK